MFLYPKFLLQLLLQCFVEVPVAFNQWFLNLNGRIQRGKEKKFLSSKN